MIWIPNSSHSTLIGVGEDLKVTTALEDWNGQPADNPYPHLRLHLPNHCGDVTLVLNSRDKAREIATELLRIVAYLDAKELADDTQTI